MFKHALIQDAAYISLLRSTRQEYPRRIAEVLADAYPEMAETQPELLAYHYTEAGLIEQAVPHWRQAGQRAIEQSAYVEAITHLRQGIEVLDGLPDTIERARYELSLQSALGAALTTTKGYGDQEVGKAYGRARELCGQAEETDQLFFVLWGLWSFYTLRSEHQTALEIGNEFLRLAQNQSDPIPILSAHRVLATTMVWLGEFTRARGYIDQTMTLYNAQPLRPLTFGYVLDPGMVALCFLSKTLWFLGYPDQALAASQESLAMARSFSHSYHQAFALSMVSMFHQLCREVEAIYKVTEEGVALTSEQGFAMFLAHGTIIQGRALSQRSQITEGLTQMKQGLSDLQATGTRLQIPHYLGLLSSEYRALGQLNKASSLLDEALALVDKSGERYCEAELYRLKGELLLQSSSGHDGEAESGFQQALDVARDQQAKSLELRAATSLARLWQSQGKREEARELLAPVYELFTEGFDTADLKDAQSLRTRSQNCSNAPWGGNRATPPKRNCENWRRPLGGINRY